MHTIIHTTIHTTMPTTIQTTIHTNMPTARIYPLTYTTDNFVNIDNNELSVPFWENRKCGHLGFETTVELNQ